MHEKLSIITNRFKGILLDAYGVFWNGNSSGLIPGAKEAMENMVSNGHAVGILSNSTQLAAKEKEKLHKHGLIEGKHYHFLLTSGEVARYLLVDQKLAFPTPKKKYYVFGGIHPKYHSHQALFEETVYSETDDLSDADFIYIAIPHIDGIDQTDPTVFLKDITQIKSYQLPMLCVNPDHFAHEGMPPRPVVRQGSIASLYEKMKGEVFYIGKPANYVFAEAMQQFYLLGIKHPSEVLMVGDTPETDIRGAKNFGLKSALVTETGIASERIRQNGLEKAIQEDIPDFFIKKLADEL